MDQITVLFFKWQPFVYFKHIYHQIRGCIGERACNAGRYRAATADYFHYVLISHLIFLVSKMTEYCEIIHHYFLAPVTNSPKPEDNEFAEKS